MAFQKVITTNHQQPLKPVHPQHKLIQTCSRRRERDRGIQTDRDRQTETYEQRQTDLQTCRGTDRQGDRQAGRQAGRKIGRQTEVGQSYTSLPSH